ncbi:MAG: hypothetical protein KI790_10775 [Cyclobacteriaceae bacterium]|nr:hypothetical protein [Cyclobacteriaceae bacterium HetDA_MAG_MS6]
MKRIILMHVLIGIAWIAYAQENFTEKVVIPLTNPGERGKLELNQVNGDIEILGYSGKEVIINVSTTSDHEKEHKKAPPAGMRRISSKAVELRAREENNEIEIETDSWKRKTNLDIKVPENFDLNIGTVHGVVKVRNVEGDLVVSSVNGEITLHEVKGSVVANTVNGKIEVRLLKVIPEVPMSFVTLNGNIDVTFPPSVKMLAKMRSDQGEIYSDFDMDTEPSKPQVKKGGDCNCEYEVSIDSWVYGAINGGGEEFVFKNMNGDILIRKGR